MPTLQESGEKPQLKYVVLRHEGIKEPHFDLMFEISADAPLATWRCKHWPLSNGDYVEQLPAHRRDYLNYEGPLSQDRGYVRRIHAGHYENTNRLSSRFSVILEDGKVLELDPHGSVNWRVFIESNEK